MVKEQLILNIKLFNITFGVIPFTFTYYHSNTF